MSAPDPIHTREQIENAWRQRLDSAAEADKAAHRDSERALQECRRLMAAPRSGDLAAARLAFEQARQHEETARADYYRILRIFVDLVVHRKLPEEELEQPGPDGIQRRAD